MSSPPRTDQIRRLRARIRGAVQGVGFRPFVFRLATELQLSGWVLNSSEGVLIEVEGRSAVLEDFVRKLDTEKPTRSFIQSLEATWLDPVGYGEFTIRDSADKGEKIAIIMADIATCPDCLAEVRDPNNRRYLYPFTNCTNCGPRFSIIETLPYDRGNTSMKRFTMCPQCQAEYEDPRDRRFHAQPNACPVCGPRLWLHGPGGKDQMSSHRGSTTNGASSSREVDAVLNATVEAIRTNQIVAVKGLGGFHLMVRADSDEAVARLRQRKNREEKPFAVMFADVDSVRRVCEVSSLEERLLRSPEAPIVLLRRVPALKSQVCAAVAPGNPNFGALLPYTPLHHLLISRLDFPVIATSGNQKDEPICTDENEAMARLGGIADLYLVHDRPIVRHVDDSIVRVMVGRQMVLRRARGFAPLPIELRTATTANCGNQPEAAPSSADPSDTVLAVGGHLKNAVALGIGPQVFVSQHLGDLETLEANNAFRRVTEDLQQLYDRRATRVAADLHPDYVSTRFAEKIAVPCHKVQHHVAHVLACMADNDLKPPVLGVAWDGTGYGLDGTIWGGEFFRITRTGFERLAHFRPFPLPGGEQAIREPRRSALGLLFEEWGESVFERIDLAPVKAFSPLERKAMARLLARKLNCPLSSGVGRLFDAAASLIGLRQRLNFEGQAAMELEFLLNGMSESGSYPFHFELRDGPLVIDWKPCVESILADLNAGAGPGTISARFHNGLAEAIVQAARRAGLEKVVLSGGCFQNRYLTEKAVARLSETGFLPYVHQRVPPNDGGLCLGQVVAARWWKV